LCSLSPIALPRCFLEFYVFTDPFPFFSPLVKRPKIDALERTSCRSCFPAFSLFYASFLFRDLPPDSTRALLGGPLVYVYLQAAYPVTLEGSCPAPGYPQHTTRSTRDMRLLALIPTLSFPCRFIWLFAPLPVDWPFPPPLPLLLTWFFEIHRKNSSSIHRTDGADAFYGRAFAFYRALQTSFPSWPPFPLSKNSDFSLL